MTLGGTFVVGSLLALRAEHPGYDGRGLVIVDARHHSSSSTERRLHVTALADAVRRALAVGTVASFDGPFLERTYSTAVGWEPPEGAHVLCMAGPKIGIGDRFVDVMGIEHRAGRLPAAAELDARAPVVVVSDPMAALCWPGRDPVGESITVGGTPFTVVGVVADARLVAYDESSLGQAYFPHDALPQPSLEIVIAARVSGPMSDAVHGIVMALRDAGLLGVCGRDGGRGDAFGGARARPAGQPYRSRRRAAGVNDSRRDCRNSCSTGRDPSPCNSYDGRGTAGARRRSGGRILMSPEIMAADQPSPLGVDPEPAPLSQSSAVPSTTWTGISVGAALFATVTGTIGLAGWVFDVEALKSVIGVITMKANMAIGLIANGLALAMVVRGSARVRHASVAPALLAAAIGGLTLGQHLFGWNLGIDELLFSEPPGAVATTSPGRMGPSGATNLLLAGLAILLLGLGGPRAVVWIHGLACTIAILATIPLAGYAYGAEQLYSIARFTGIAFPTALGLLALSIGILAARAETGVMAVLGASGAGGVMARRLLLPAIVLPLLLGYLRTLGERANLYDTGLGTALLTISLGAILMILVWRTAVQLDAVDAERQRAEQERAGLLERERQARLEVEHANRLKDHFLATLSHELRTPLNAILGYAHMLRTGALRPEQRHQAIEVIERNAAAQNQLVDDLLDMSRMTTGRIRLEKHSVPVLVPLREAIESITPAADAKRIALHVEADPSPGNVYGDDGRLRQVFWNLLSNAVKFTPEGGQIHIGLRADRTSVSVTVRDSGVGMAAAFLPHVFEAFRQGDIGSSRRYGGLGLGLAIGKQLAELHGGSISAASDGPGRGATFTVRLPRYVHDPATTAPSPAAAEPAPLRSPSSRCDLTGMDVLAVDDDPDSLDLARHLLASMGAAVRTASDAPAALHQFDARVPDLLIVDIGLPGMDGFELLQEIRSRGEEGRSVPAIAVTAFAGPNDRRRTHAAGFARHIAKPIDPDTFSRTLAEALGNSRPHRPGDVSLA